MKNRWILLLILCLSACASHELRCDGRLQPINLPKGNASTLVDPVRSGP